MHEETCMTEDEILIKIKEYCAKDDHKWWLTWFDGKATFEFTQTQPWYNIQVIQQLPDEFSTTMFFNNVTLNKDGVKTKKLFYEWADILLTGIRKFEGTRYLILGLKTGEVVGLELGYNGKYTGSDNAAEFGHMVELYKHKHKKENSKADT